MARIKDIRLLTLTLNPAYLVAADRRCSVTRRQALPMWTEAQPARSLEQPFHGCLSKVNSRAAQARPARFTIG
jgi:hypothetical protein